MQSFINIQSTDTLANSRQEILNNDLTIMSCSSGTSFPTTNLVVGMFCLRTDLGTAGQLYQLKDLSPTWVLIFDLAKVFVDKAYVDAQDATKVSTTQVVTAPTANKILQLDASGNLPASITGNAASASAVAWGNITGRPSAFTPPVAAAGVLGGVIPGAGLAIDGSGNLSVSGGTSGTFSASTQPYRRLPAGTSPPTNGPIDVQTGSGTIISYFHNIQTGVGAQTTTFASLIQQLINLSHYHYMEKQLSVATNCSNCCFAPGTKVLMEEGNYKNIEDVVVGDRVVGLGGANNILDTYVVTLGPHAKVVTPRDTRDLKMSGQHPIWVRTPEGREYFGTHDLHLWKRDQKHAIYAGKPMIGLTKEDPYVILDPTEYAHVTGWKRQEFVVDHSFDENSVLVHLVVDGSHTFTADGYVVAGRANDEDFDYNNVRWEAVEDDCR
ncbi:MAG: hypothetical protein P4N59_29725 [Negativicutes bacterium]|nr:hypothetical protein [Negativicutes bacterium]